MTAGSVREVDVVVVGSGGAGLVSALAAGASGLEVTVLEKAPVFGGTSAVSGGVIWIPCNGPAARDGVQDTRELALTYLRGVTLGTVDDRFLVQYVDTGNEVVDFLEKTTPIQFEANLHWPDYVPDLPGALTGGRALQPGLYDTNRLGALKPKLRSPHSMAPFTHHEWHEWGIDLAVWDWATIAERQAKGWVGWGAAFVGQLLEGCMTLGVNLLTGASAAELVHENGRVTGIWYVHEGQRELIRARRGVVLACGGFEWNQEYVTRFLGVPMHSPASPPYNEGDGLRMAMEVGAALGNMSEAWWTPVYDVPGDTYDGQPLHRCVGGISILPGSLTVNKCGRRFANEAMNYNEFGKMQKYFDSGAYDWVNAEPWAIFGQEYRQKYAIGTVMPSDPDPKWLISAPTLPELAEKIGVPAGELVETVRQFDSDAATGHDRFFLRGQHAYDNFYGDPSRGPDHVTVAPVGEGPYYAVQTPLGVLGTKGGPVTDLSGRVLDTHEEPIPGLYAAGNTAASIFGPGYPGAGATLGAGSVMGYHIGRALANKG